MGLIHTERGLIEVVDRAGLKGAACECYVVIEENQNRFLPRAPD